MLKVIGAGTFLVAIIIGVAWGMGDVNAWVIGSALAAGGVAAYMEHRRQVNKAA